ncbi:HlyD family type I secretion periplasmic adaptor subunit [Bradyrhizobium sp. STM 3809]|uniref:HlyD family type I secretion periplasmic adaptor subunit n=1 Tax=Bradyrhizobium sp. STM 3809 TaxID=551936 RepID=UPI00024097B1|nr:HlyD family type I secretion periplasmic adaptor subunit [Bradyrhizobium sp. STM 3809]CCE01214.1 putative HlyD family secretion protein [Bradyrhizobium sp. STM 3809]
MSTPASLLRGFSFGGKASEREFLPAALEITETPPNPLGRITVLALCTVTFAALGWAVFGKVDIVAVASGKVISHTRTQVVQPFETASVKAVLVQPGQRVRAGDALIELDKTAVTAETDRARSDLIASLLDEVRLAAFLDGVKDGPFELVAGAEPLDRARAQAQLTAQLAMRASQLAALAQERAQHIAEREALQQTVAKYEQTLPMVTQRADIRTKASEIGNASIIALLESQQLLVETRSELEINKAKIVALDATIAGLDQKIAATEADMRDKAMRDLATARERARAAGEALTKATRRAELQTLRAPIDGTVQQMHVAAAGAVVTPAQQLLSVVPDDDRIEVEAVVENRDVGFVEAGQRVELKVDAFPFTRYGLLGGKVTSVDRDAEAAPVNPNGVQGAERQADQTDRVEASERLRYMVHIALDRATLDVDGRAAALVPGMSVKAEILTGKRRIIDFLLAPLSEHVHDAMRER